MLRERTKNILKEHGIRLSKNKGQSHVVEEGILERMVNYANLSSDDRVLEIGPGIGNLTRVLIESAGKVVAIEKDEDLVEVLRDRFGDEPELDIIQGDVLETDLPKFEKVVSNLPYSISSPLTFKLFDQSFDLGVLMYQREFARRMVASAGSSDYSRLSVNVAYHAQAELLEEVPPNVFIPQPEVRSAIVKIEIQEPSFDLRNEDIFPKVVKAIFQHRRKKIRNSLFHSFQIIFPEKSFSKEEKRSHIKRAVSDELLNSRAGEISPEEFGNIVDALDREIS